jgi:glyoxylase-like metal-dependent hydrolase (beta-lactamase superfamily II)
MQSISRRGFVISAAAASAAFGLDGPMEFVRPAFAQKSDPALLEKGFVKFKVGDIEVTQVYDGIWNRELQDGFVKNQTLDDVKNALKAAGLADNIVPITFTVTLVTIGGKTTMFDSGTGVAGQVAPTSGLLASKHISAAGIDPTKIENFVVTHFHPDHISGLFDKDSGAPKYPNATIHVPTPELAFWTGSSVPQAAQGLANRVKSTLGTWSNVKQIEGEKEVVPGIRSLPLPGHTPGHTSYHLSSGNQQLIVLGDITNIPALFVKNPGWHAVFDSDAALAEANRRKIFDRAIADKVTVTGYHYGLPGAGTIQKDGAGYAFVPVSV